MNCLLYCTEILGVLLFIPWCACSNQSVTVDSADISTGTATDSVYRDVTLNAGSTETVPHTVKQSTSPSPSPTPTPTPCPPQPTTLSLLDLQNPFFPVVLVCAGLTILCILLLIAMLILVCKVCHLSRRLKMISRNSDLIMNSEYQMETVNENKTKETSVLLTQISQTNQEMNGTTKEDGGQVSEDGKMGEEKEVGATPSSEEASKPAATADSSSTSKPQEEAASSEATPAAAASTSEGTEEPKDVE